MVDYLCFLSQQSKPGALLKLGAAKGIALTTLPCPVALLCFCEAKQLNAEIPPVRMRSRDSKERDAMSAVAPSAKASCACAMIPIQSCAYL
jgi:hypothetical protein